MPNDLVCPVHGRRHYSAFDSNGECFECRSQGIVSQGVLASLVDAQRAVDIADLEAIEACRNHLMTTPFAKDPAVAEMANAVIAATAGVSPLLRQLREAQKQVA